MSNSCNHELIDYRGPHNDACGRPDVGLHDSEKHSPPPDLFGQSVSLMLWCQHLVALVFRSRTSFAAFVRKSIHLPRDDVLSESPAFPVPLPFVGVFDRMPSGLSLRKRNRVHFRRAVVIMVLALNFWWSGGKFVDPNLLRRVPSSSQKAVIRRVADLLQVDGPMVEVPLTSVGRRVPQLVARLSELSEMLTSSGLQFDPYTRAFEGRKEVPLRNEVMEELEPYRNLDAERIKVTGTGHWDPLEFISDDLVMAYRNPDCLLYHCSYEGVNLPNHNDSLDEIVRLSKKWDEKNLLYLHEFNIPKVYPEERVRIFNCYKNQDCDRQIGDRRGRNHAEMRIHGPSSRLPSGPDLCELFVNPFTDRVSISIKDRSDFYHQFKVTESRSISNTLSLGIPLHMIADTSAYTAWALAKARKLKDRRLVGDGFLSSRFTTPEKGMPEVLYPSFKSILQGDHAGVEFACSCHEGLLSSVGLLDSQSRLIADKPFEGSSLMQGLVIDDYFAVSVVPKNSEMDSPDTKCFDTANAAYEEHGLKGSPSKDSYGEQKAKVIGASIDSSPQCLRKGIIPLGAPSAKRFALAWITLQLCALSHTTDVLFLSLLGGWVSCLSYRRPLMSLLNASFRLIDANAVNSLHPRLVALPRIVACELCLLSVLRSMAVFDLASDVIDTVYATDASNDKGAICSTSVPHEYARCLWRLSRSKGAYHRLLTPLQVLSRRLGIFEEKGPEACVSPSRPIAFHYDFIEVFSGAARVSKAIGLLGFVVGPPIDLSISGEYNVEWPHVLAWVSFMIVSGHLLAFMVEPPCTSFSIMRKPALRSKLCPYGFCTSHPQTANGNLLAHRALQLMRLGLVNGISGILEQPFSSLMKHLPAYKHICKSPFVRCCRTDSCMFGSPHLKPFRFLSVHLPLEGLNVRCDRSHEHIQIQGSYTRSSAVYTDLLAERLASVFSVGIRAAKARLSDLDFPSVKGLESQVVNSLALSSQWKIDSHWRFKKLSHINILDVCGRSPM